jgi:hypothetical protein
VSRFRSLILAGLALALAGIGPAGCGSSDEGPEPQASAHLIRSAGQPHGVIVLTALGAERIGLSTSPVHPAAGRAHVLVPASAIVYDASGHPLAFTRVSPLHFVMQPVDLVRFAGGAALLRGGPRAGSQVVSVGAEELLGVQSGVLEQT